MCDCIENMKKRLLEQQKIDDKVIKNVDFNNISFPIINNSIVSATYEEFEVLLEGLKRPKKIKVMHTYCPYCAEPILNK